MVELRDFARSWHNSLIGYWNEAQAPMRTCDAYMLKREKTSDSKTIAVLSIINWNIKYPRNVDQNTMHFNISMQMD